ncbi:MAG: thiamine pyrophosphate-dependent dehydrogenase E1 component subunit alpha [Verrucomicrobia bacterium]|nr:thiamine pyrophosphate-dependent dehydrogenase E1 component subunit alpha [Verrucomicrobiota bacterium]
MLLARTVEDKVAALWHAGKIAGGCYLGKGQEAVSVAVGIMLRPGDIFAPLIRDQAGRLAFGEPLFDILRTYLGKKTGPMRGRDGNVHRGRPKEGIYPMVSHLGATASLITGALMARRMQGETGIVGATSIGDGGSSTGSFHEGFNMAAVERVPLVMTVTNNHYAYSTPNSRQFACHDLVDRAIGYGVEGYSMDGTDLKECLETASHAVERARSGFGVQMIVASCVRLSGHAEHDDGFYMDKTLLDSPIGRDCLNVAQAHVVEQGWADEVTVQEWRQQAKAQVEDTLQKVQREPTPDPADEDWHSLASAHLIDPEYAE